MEKKTAETRIDAVQLIGRSIARKPGYMVWIHQDHQWISYGSCGYDKDRAMAYTETICREKRILGL
jgi:hypothetical protein